LPARRIACDATAHSVLREIRQCWPRVRPLACASRAANRGIEPRAIDVAALRDALRKQHAFVRDRVHAGASTAGAERELVHTRPVAV
jgi:hypothetical protein